MYPEDMALGVLTSESIAVFNGDLGLPVRHISEMSTFITRQTHPTPPMPASATRLWTLNCWPIFVIISSRPMNFFESLSKGTVKHADRDGDSRSDKFAEIKTRLIRL